MLRLTKTASFRLPVLFALIFGVGFTVLILITYVTASTALREQTTVDVEIPETLT